MKKYILSVFAAMMMVGCSPKVQTQSNHSGETFYVLKSGEKTVRAFYNEKDCQEINKAFLNSDGTCVPFFLTKEQINILKNASR